MGQPSFSRSSEAEVRLQPRLQVVRGREGGVLAAVTGRGGECKHWEKNIKSEI